MTYELQFSTNFRRVFRKKEQQMKDAVSDCIRKLAANPHHPGLNTHKMKGTRDEVWEAYVDKGNRVTFHYEGDRIVLRNNCNHDILYRNP